MDESIKYVEVLFRNYYRNYFNPPNIPRVENREFAYQPFNSQSMIRHMGFRDWSELRNFIIERNPRNLYISSAYFRNPSINDMEAKGWLGADLVFDIDGDHLPTENCRGVELITIECLNDALNEVRKLIDILIYEFGIDEGNIRLTFSGHRGFHVHVEGPEDVISLTQDERRLMVDYLIGKVDLTRQVLINQLRKTRLLEIPQLSEPSQLHRLYGSIGRVIKAASRYGKVTVGLIRSKAGELNADLAIHIDEVVTIDTNRLMRLPNSLHGKTGLSAIELSIRDLDSGIEAVLNKAIVFRKGHPRIRLVKELPISRVLGEDIHIKRPNDEGDVPTYVAVYLILMGIAQLAE